MVYVPVGPWVNGGAPPISAANLDHIETQHEQSCLGIFGDGSDGNVTTAGGGGGSFSLTRDMFYNQFTVSIGDTVTTAGFRIFAKDWLVNLGTIERNGNSAIAAAGGVALSVGTLFGSSAGGAGGVNAAGGAGTGETNSGSGGAGGAGGAATAAGGVGGAASVNAFYGHLRALPQAISCQVRIEGAAYFFRGIGGSGGGGGGDATPGTGGGGGGSAGLLIIVARELYNQSMIESNGGAGANGVAANGGGGGGGGGGTLVLISNKFQSAGIERALAGTAGAGIGTGNAGVAGSAGLVIQLDNV